MPQTGSNSASDRALRAVRPNANQMRLIHHHQPPERSGSCGAPGKCSITPKEAALATRRAGSWATLRERSLSAIRCLPPGHGNRYVASACFASACPDSLVRTIANDIRPGSDIADAAVPQNIRSPVLSAAIKPRNPRMKKGAKNRLATNTQMEGPPSKNTGTKSKPFMTLESGPSPR